MRSRVDVDAVLDLARAGLTSAEIARRTGLPRTTVRDWRRRGASHPPACATCGAPHDLGALPERYVYLLGLYLGDGCLSSHPRGVYRLRVFLDWQSVLVERWPAALVRGLIHSDGCRFHNTGRGGGAPRYSFSNRSADILAIFQGVCDLLGLRWTVAPHTVYVSRKADVARLDEIVGPKR